MEEKDGIISFKAVKQARMSALSLAQRSSALKVCMSVYLVNLVISLIRLVPKSTPGKFRLGFDLSYPRGH